MGAAVFCERRSGSGRAAEEEEELTHEARFVPRPYWEERLGGRLPL